MKLLSRVQLFATPWTVAYEAPPSMGFSRQECWSGLPFPSPGDLPDPGIEPGSPALEADALTSEPPGKIKYFTRLITSIFISLLPYLIILLHNCQDYLPQRIIRWCRLCLLLEYQIKHFQTNNSAYNFTMNFNTLLEPFHLVLFSVKVASTALCPSVFIVCLFVCF